MTFLEVVLSVVLLSVVASMVMSAINGMLAAQNTHRQRLGAAELANRLTLQYLDDKRSMPASGAPIVYGRDKYRWEYVERPVTITPARPEALQTRNTASQSLNRLINVTVRVWLCEESGGTYAYDADEPSYVLSRIVNPVALRNPDSIDRMLKNPEAYREFLANLTGGSTAPNAPARPDQPATPGKGGTGKGGTGKTPAPTGGKPAAGRTTGGAK
jgi:type II secretory pathway pseudopilin PulG